MVIEKEFCVVQFIELPFENVDDYECVPKSWVILTRSKDSNVRVVYPKDEDPFDTRERVERKEQFNENWMSYQAVAKYESNSYKDAEFWIACRNDYGPIIANEVPYTTGSQPTPVLNSRLQSDIQYPSSSYNVKKPLLVAHPFENTQKPMFKITTKRCVPSTHEELDKKRLKLDTAAESTMDESSENPLSSDEEEVSVYENDSDYEIEFD